jgi:3',5'-cyclic AMP phosphodiesterase CpdA
MTVQTVTFAHLSDLHLPPLPHLSLADVNLKRALGFLNWQRKRRRIHTRAALDAIAADVNAQQPDHILVSGDLVNIGLPAEYAAALDWLETIGPPERVSVVPGNHDIYTRTHSGPGVAVWMDYMRSDAFGVEIGATQHTPPRGLDNLTGGFPYVRRIGPVAVIGLNSAEPTPVGLATGRLGVPQLDRLARVLDSVHRTGLFALIMIHHPPLPGLAPRRRALIDAHALEGVLRSHGAGLVIHGHNHRNMRCTLPSATGPIPVIGVATASAASAHGAEPAACYNLVRITANPTGPATVAIKTRGISAGGTAVGPIELEPWTE